MATLRREDLINQIPLDVGVAPAAVAPDPLSAALDTELGRNVTNAALAIPPAAAAAGALRTMRLGAAGLRATRAGRPAVPALDVARAAGAAPVAAAASNTLRNTAALGAAGTALGAGMYVAGAPELPGANPAATGPVGGTATAIAPTAPTQPVEPTQPAITRVGNSFSGNFPAPPAQDLRGAPLGSLADTNAQIASLRGTGAPSMSVIGAPIDPNRNAEFNDGAALRTALSRTITTRRGTVLDPSAELIAGQIGLRTKERIEGARIAGDASTNEARIAAERGIAAQRDATDRRGQDLQAQTAEGQQLVSLRNNAANNSREQAQLNETVRNNDRNYQIELAKLGKAKADDNYKVRQTGMEDLTKQYASYLPPGADGKPDLVAAARQAPQINAALAQREQQLAAEVQKNPGNTAAATALKALQEKGAAALSEPDKRKLIEGVRANGAAMQSDSLMGGRFGIGGRGVDSDQPVTGLRKESRAFGNVYVDDAGRVIPASVIEGRRGFFGIGAQPSNQYDSLRQR